MKSILKISISTIFQSMGMLFLFVVPLFFFAGKLIWKAFFMPFQGGVSCFILGLFILCVALIGSIGLFGVLLTGLNKWHWDKEYLNVYYLGFFKKEYQLSNLKSYHLERVSGSREHNIKTYQLLFLCFEDPKTANKRTTLSFASKDFKNFDFLVEQIEFLAIPKDEKLGGELSLVYFILLGIIVFLLLFLAIFTKVVEYI